jgi:hypothetical protein
MLENCLSGSEGGGAIALPTPMCAAEEHITAGESPALFNRERTRSTKKGRRREAGSEATECEMTSPQRK